MATPATRADRRHAVRVACLLSGLACCATGIVLTLRAGLGVSPWDVLHAGIAERLGVDFGTVVIGLGAVVLAASLLLGVRPGGGTVANMLLIGLMENALLDLGVLDRLADGALLPRVVVLVVGVATIGLGSAL